MHLYYTTVIAKLFSGSSLFSQFFSIRLPPPPYALHYYLLWSLETVFTPNVAEKILVCLSIVLFAFGFRFVLAALGPLNGYLYLWIVPLTLSWMLGMGFYNYCLSLGMELWAIGLWLLATTKRSVRLWVVYLVIVALMIVTHPVPVLFLLGFVACEMAFRALNDFRRGPGTLQQARAILGHFKTDLLFFGLSCCLAAYVLLFIDPHRAADNTTSNFFDRSTLLSFFRLRPLGLTTGTFLSRLYRFAFYLLLVTLLGSWVKGILKRWKRSELNRSDLFGLLSVFLIILLPMLPRTVNGSDFFSDRLVIFIWIGGIAAAANLEPARWLRSRYSQAVAIVFSLFALILSDHYVRPAAQIISGIEANIKSAPSDRGFSLAPVVPYETQLSSGDLSLSFDPFVWSAARYFRLTDTVMLNAPWLDQHHMPIQPKGTLFGNILPAQINDYPDKFYLEMARSTKDRYEVQKLAQFMVLIKYPGFETIAKNMPQWLKAWHCGGDHWLSVCTPTPDRP